MAKTRLPMGVLGLVAVIVGCGGTETGAPGTAGSQLGTSAGSPSQSSGSMQYRPSSQYFAGSDAVPAPGPTEPVRPVGQAYVAGVFLRALRRKLLDAGYSESRAHDPQVVGAIGSLTVADRGSRFTLALFASQGAARESERALRGDSRAIARSGPVVFTSAPRRDGRPIRPAFRRFVRTAEGTSSGSVR